MKSDPAEYKEIIKKLLEKTRQRKVGWGQAYSSSFRCTLPGGPESFHVTISEADRSIVEPRLITLRMSDQAENIIFEASTNDLPTSSAEEEVSQMIEEIYDLARRQALRIEHKLEKASLDQA
jgi:hypothetical protein